MIDKNTTYFVYWLRNASCVDVSEDGYVGVTYNPRQRYQSHKWSKRFPSDFEMEIIFQGLQPECLAKEIELRPAAGIGWNRAMGGPNGYRHGHSQETRAKISASSSRRDCSMSPETRAKLSAAHKGKKFSAEHRANLSAVKRGKPVSDAARSALVKANLGNTYQLGLKRTQEVRDKISRALIGNQYRKGKKHTEETREKIGAWSRGKPRSAEVRAKIKAGHIARRQNKQTEEAASPWIF